MDVWASNRSGTNKDADVSDEKEQLTITFTRWEGRNRGMFNVTTDIKTIPLKVVVDALRYLANHIEEELDRESPRGGS